MEEGALGRYKATLLIKRAGFHMVLELVLSQYIENLISTLVDGGFPLLCFVLGRIIFEN